MKRRKREHMKPILRRDITYINGVQMEDAVEIIRHCLFRDDEMDIVHCEIRNAEEFRNVYMDLIKYWEFERCLSELHTNTRRDAFFYYGKCAVCNSVQPFIVDEQFADIEEGRKMLNWRERMVCPNCGCNSRQRYIIGKIFEYYEPGMRFLLYERNSNVFRVVSREIPDVEGFEYAGEAYAENVYNEIVCKDVCCLNYTDESFELLVSNDVFQHVHDYRTAFQEAYRILKPDGKLIFTVPFNGNSSETEVRAKVGEKGVVYIQDRWCSPNPIAGLEPLPVYQIFGWDILETLKASGFKDAYGKIYYGLKDGYMGYLPMYFEACK